MDLHDELEIAIGHGPALPPPTDRLAAGRRALRRRRALVAAGAAAAVTAVVLPVAAFSGGNATGGREVAPAGRPEPSASASASAPASPSPKPSKDRAGRQERFDPSMGEAAYVDVVTGELMVDPDAVVLRRVDDLYPGKDTDSVALDLRLDGGRTWVALEWDEGGSSGTYGGPDNPFYTGWEDFLAKATSGGGMTDGGPTRNRGGGGASGDEPVPGEVTGLTVEGETFRSKGSATILEQQPSPDLPDNFAMPGEATAAAYVEQDGVRYLVLSRPGGLITVESAGHGDSLDALLAWARERYESEAGLL